MKRSLISAAVLLFALAFVTPAQQRVKYTYFYPMPVGTVGASCTSAGEGTEGYDSTTHQLLVCGGSPLLWTAFATSALSLPLADNLTLFENSGDVTKLGKFSLAGLTHGTTRTWTWQDQSLTVAGINVPQTWTADQTHAANLLFSGSHAIGSTSVPVANVYAGYLETNNELLLYDNAWVNHWSFDGASIAGRLIIRDPGNTIRMEIDNSGYLSFGGDILPIGDNVYMSGNVGNAWSNVQTYKINGVTPGTVSSVAMTVPSGLSISGSPITGSGTLGLTWTGGTAPFLPLSGGTLSGDLLFSGSHAIGSTSVPVGNLYAGFLETNNAALFYDSSWSNHWSVDGSSIAGRLIIKDPGNTVRLEIDSSGYAQLNGSIFAYADNTFVNGTASYRWSDTETVKLNAQTAPTTGFLDSQNGYKKAQFGESNFNGGVTATFTTSLSFTPDYCLATTLVATEYVTASISGGQCVFQSSVGLSTDLFFWQVVGH
jgi:hypothetical protein